MERQSPVLEEIAEQDAREACSSRWYACYTRARHEKQVARVLDDRGFEAYLPLVPRERRWKDRLKVVDMPLFPSYVFGRFTLDRIGEVLHCPGVSTIVRCDGLPAAIPDDEIENVRRFALALTNSDVKLEAICHVVVGQRVRVVSGCLAGVEGVVQEVRGNKRFCVGVTAIQQGWRVRIGAELLKPLD